MNASSAKSGPRLAPITANQVLEELAELIQDLHELLDSYGPAWYSEEMDTRMVNMLGKLTSPQSSPGECTEQTIGQR